MDRPTVLAALLLSASCHPGGDARPAPASTPATTPAAAPVPAHEPEPGPAGVTDASSEASPDAEPEAGGATRTPVPTPTREALVQAVLDALAASDLEALMALTPTPEEIANACSAADGLAPDGRDMLQHSIRTCSGYVATGSRPKLTTGGAVTGPYAKCRAVERSKFLVVTIAGPSGGPREVEVRIDEPARVAGRWVILDNPRCSPK